MDVENRTVYEVQWNMKCYDEITRRNMNLMPLNWVLCSDVTDYADPGHASSFTVAFPPLKLLYVAGKLSRMAPFHPSFVVTLFQ